MIDIVQLIKDGHGKVAWGNMSAEHNGHKLIFSAMLDAVKFDNIPALTWDRKPVPGNSNTFNGVRLAATAQELQEIAYLTGCMLMTPKIVDMIYTEALNTGTHLESVVNVHGQIVAMANINDVHEALETALAKVNGNKSGFIECVGKYWVICNELLIGKWGARQAANYGWFTKLAGNGPSVTKVSNIWQTLGIAHDASHQDPSQVIRMVSRMAKLLPANSTTGLWEDVDLVDLLGDPDLAPLISHQGVVKAKVVACAPVVAKSVSLGDVGPDMSNV